MSGKHAGAPNSLPRPEQLRWFEAELLGAVLGAILPVIAAAAITLTSGIIDRKPIVAVASGVTILLLVLNGALSVARSRAKDRRDNQRRTPNDFTACLYTAHAAILAHKGLPYTDENRKKLRITIHRVDEGKEKVLQLVDYVGGDGGGAGREFSSRSGLVGRAIIAHDKPAIMEHKVPYDEYLQILRDEYHMPEEEARLVSRDRFSLMATAIKSGASVIGVVFMDSSEQGFFDKSTADLASAACAAVAQYIRLRHQTG